MNTQRWLNRNPPNKVKGAHVLVLHAHGAPAPLARWSPEEVELERTQTLARSIEELATEHAEEQRCAVSFRLTWESEDGAALIANSWIAGTGERALDGTEDSRRAQEQRERSELHTFAMSAMKLVIAQQRDHIGVLEKDNDQLRTRLEAMEAVATEEAINERATTEKVHKRTVFEMTVEKLLESHSSEVVDFVKGLLPAGGPQAPNGQTPPSEASAPVLATSEGGAE